MSENFIAIGADELGGPIPRIIKCSHCGEEHEIKDSPPSERVLPDGTREQGPAGLLQYYNCSGKTYLAGLDGRDIRRKFK